MTNKSTRLAALLAGALSFAAPLALGSATADAAPVHGGGGMMQGGFHNDMGHVDTMHDQRHQPPGRHEARPRMPHRGYHWHEGQWKWQRNQWQWIAGFWNIR